MDLFKNYTDLQKFGLGGGLGMLGGGLGGLFGGGGRDANKYLDQMPGQIGKYYDPYIQAGQRALPGLEDQYGQLLKNPGGRMNEIGQGYQQSPGFQFALQQALGGAGHAAAAGGMAGSPQHEQQAMGVATGLANQDYNNWMQNALGMYGMGMQGQQGLYDTGAKASMGMGEQMAQMLAAKSKLAYQNDSNKSQGWGSMIGGAMTALPFLFSSKELKEYDSTPSTEDILNNVRELSLDKWKYKGIDQKFLGSYAEEFSNLFGVGDGKTINLIDAIGVLLGSIKELDKKVRLLEGEKNALHNA